MTTSDLAHFRRLRFRGSTKPTSRSAKLQAANHVPGGVALAFTQSPPTIPILCHFSSLTLVITLCLSAILGCASTQTAEHPTTAPSTFREAEEIKTALTYIASDQLEGRGLETEGINKAADYIATQFRKDGLGRLPALNGYFQEFPITSRRRLEQTRRFR